MKRKRICFVVASLATANAFLRDHIEALSKDYDVYLVCNKNILGLQISLAVKEVKHVEIMRGISLVKDMKAVLALKDYFKEMKFDAVHSVTPKAGLTTALAARFAGIKIRIHIFTGQVWATKHGPMRQLLMFMDKVIARFDTHILVDGESQRQFLIQNGIIRDNQAKVLGAGSISGVNTVRFTPLEGIKEELRDKIGIDKNKVVFTFMGRLNKDKGAYEMFSAFNKLVAKHKDVFLLLFGSDEGDCLSHLSEYENIKNKENFLFYGLTAEPQLDLQVSDVFCMPSYREGFGTSVIEASCLGLPVICSDAYGIMDAMVENQTGLRCRVADVNTLYVAMERLYNSAELRAKLGDNGRKRTLKYFSGNVITAEWVKFYNLLIS